MKKLFKSGASAAIAAIAAVALMTGNIAFAVPGNGDNPNGRPFQEEPVETSVGISHTSEGGVVPAASPHGLPGSIEIKVYCQQEGHLAVGGGYSAGSYKGGVTTYQNRNTTEPVGDANYGKGWLVGFTNHNTTPQNVRAWVVCAEAHEDEL